MLGLLDGGYRQAVRMVTDNLGVDVVAAPPGVRTSADLPMVVGRTDRTLLQPVTNAPARGGVTNASARGGVTNAPARGEDR
ncbi:hypothetical protein OED52_05935 [Rhodococcus sp. Z13]|uniref:Uncharacterized protein n=1 Tax=Rhodococcus sacchari TaxID=2962047 RepID=A0ACD4DJ87_9NOCA|nr:hypothetical protein [Rhodococcus sp. Z13]UYP20082.1 hypothetical protein OED52_05935 [Rhodococcus sp. Z13]